MLRQSSGLGLHSEGSRTLMLIFFGANDATSPDYHMHVPLDEYGENLRAIARRCQDIMPGITLVFVSPPPIDVDKLVECVSNTPALSCVRLFCFILPAWCEDAHDFDSCSLCRRFDWYAGRSTELAGAYAEEVARAAEDTGALFFDLHSLMIRKAEWKSFLSGERPNVALRRQSSAA